MYSRAAWILILILLLPQLSTAESAPLPGVHSATEGPVYQVGALDLAYAEPHSDLPSLEALGQLDFALGLADDGYVGARSGGNNVWFTLSEFADASPLRVYASGLRELSEWVVRELNAAGLIGVYVAPHPDDIDPGSGRDLRDSSEERLRLVVYAGRVSGLRTFASGDAHVESRVNSARHQGIRDHSPIQPVGAEGREQPDVLLKKELEEYVAHLNRHPGRRVDMSFAPSQRPGGVFVDYRVAEDKPWVVYSQISDSGTDRTGTWRQRLGFSHYQLTGNDDILRLDYVTGVNDFDSVQAYLASYEFPLESMDRTRVRLSAKLTGYESESVGFAGKFSGDVWGLGGEIIRSVYQSEDWFLDMTLGMRWLDVEVDNLGFGGHERFLLPKLGFQVDRLRSTSSASGSLEFEHNLASLAGTSGKEADLLKLGRRFVDDDFSVMRWNGEYRFYLEPVLHPIAWAYPRTSSSSTLAHEISLSTTGQYAFGSRVISQQQQVLGGLYSVRGYEQSLIAADNVVKATAEYRYHWPRAFPVEAMPRQLPLIGDFRIAPQRVYGRPDWDLVLRGFVDAAHVWFSDSVGGEPSETLASIGIGLELVIRRNVFLRWDYGLALQDVRGVDSGDREAHFSATVRY